MLHIHRILTHLLQQKNVHDRDAAGGPKEQYLNLNRTEQCKLYGETELLNDNAMLTE